MKITLVFWEKGSTIQFVNICGCCYWIAAEPYQHVNFMVMLESSHMAFVGRKNTSYKISLGNWLSVSLLEMLTNGLIEDVEFLV